MVLKKNLDIRIAIPADIKSLRKKIISGLMTS